MRTLITAISCTFIALCSHAQTNASAYSKSLADSLGADAYGMKSYILVILKTSANTTAEKSIIDSAFHGHLQNIGRLAAENKLVLAGPLGKNDKTYEGIFVLNVKTTEEAKKLLDTDPAIKAGLLAVELYQWYGSAALPMYLPYHKKVQKNQF